MERLAFIFETAWNFYQIENSLIEKELTQTSTPQEESEVKGIAKFFRTLAVQLQAVYDPHLIPVTSGGIIIDWVDSRTGDRPWFS